MRQCITETKNILYLSAFIGCCVCKREAIGANRCLACKMIVHVTCGKHPDGIEEGYGAGVICNNCRDALKAGGTEVVLTTPMSISIFFAYVKKWTD